MPTELSTPDAHRPPEAVLIRAGVRVFAVVMKQLGPQSDLYESVGSGGAAAVGLGCVALRVFVPSGVDLLLSGGY